MSIKAPSWENVAAWAIAPPLRRGRFSTTPLASPASTRAPAGVPPGRLGGFLFPHPHS